MDQDDFCVFQPECGIEEELIFGLKEPRKNGFGINAMGNVSEKILFWFFEK